MQVNLKWAVVPNAIYYRIYRGTQTGGPYLLVGQSNPNPGQQSTNAGIVTTYQDGPGNLSNGQNYFYVISTVTVDGESPYSAEIPAVAPGQPASPVGSAVIS